MYKKYRLWLGTPYFPTMYYHIFANKKRKLYDYDVDVYRKIFMKLAGDLVIEQFLELNLVDLNTTLNIKKPEINKLLKNITSYHICYYLKNMI